MVYNRIPPNLWLRLKSGAGVGVAVFVVVFGIAGTIITAISATQTRVPWKFDFLAAVCCLAIGIGAAYLRGEMKQIPDSFIDEVCSDGKYTFLH